MLKEYNYTKNLLMKNFGKSQQRAFGLHWNSKIKKNKKQQYKGLNVTDGKLDQLGIHCDLFRTKAWKRLAV